jgi:hypothetical protein
MSLDEKARRVYYQDIVYSVCNALDRIFAKRPGRGVVCGTADEPSTQVQELMQEVASRCQQWAEAQAKSQTGDGPMPEQDAATVVSGSLTDAEEVGRLYAEFRRLRAQIAGHAERIAAQSELLSKRAEKSTESYDSVDTPAVVPAKEPS